jgi:hypothetical protein
MTFKVVLRHALDNVKDLRDALALERGANDGEVSKRTRDFWSVLLANAASLHSELGKLLEQARTEFNFAGTVGENKPSSPEPYLV